VTLRASEEFLVFYRYAEDGILEFKRIADTRKTSRNVFYEGSSVCRGIIVPYETAIKTPITGFSGVRNGDGRLKESFVSVCTRFLWARQKIAGLTFLLAVSRPQVEPRFATIEFYLRSHVRSRGQLLRVIPLLWTFSFDGYQRRNTSVHFMPLAVHYFGRLHRGGIIRARFRQYFHERNIRRTVPRTRIGLRFASERWHKIIPSCNNVRGNKHFYAIM